MGMRKAVDDIVRIVIARASIPVVKTSIGRKLNHTEGNRRARKSVPMTAGSDEGVDVARVIFGLGREANAKEQDPKTKKLGMSPSKFHIYGPCQNPRAVLIAGISHYTQNIQNSAYFGNSANLILAILLDAAGETTTVCL